MWQMRLIYKSRAPFSTQGVNAGVVRSDISLIIYGKGSLSLCGDRQAVIESMVYGA